MSFYPVVPPAVTLSAGEDAIAELPGGAGMVAVRLADLVSPAGAGLGKDGRSALVAAGAGKIRTGDLVLFCKPVAVAAAVVRRDGRVQAAGHLSDHVRLGVAEERLDELCGRPGVIDEIARNLPLKGKIKGDRLRVMTPALAIRFILLMTLMPAGYAEVLAALAGDLAAVPWHRPWAVPVPAVASAWRDAIGPEPLEWLRDMLLAGIDAEHQDHDYRAVTVGDLDVYSADGCLTRVPDTPANRDAFGSAGTADDSSPYPQLREVRFSNASTRATVAVTCGPSGAAAGGGREKGEAEQVLLDKALEIYPRLFTDRRIWVMDRNFPGVPRIRRLLGTGTHVLIRLKSDIPLRRAGAFLPDGSYLAELSGGGETLTVRVIEYTVTVDGSDAPEMFCLISDLLDHAAYPAEALAAAYHWRWIGSETALKEAKSAISGAGPSTGAMLRSGSPALIAQEHAAWIISAELARATARAAASIAVPARKGTRAGQPVHPREISFTAARRTIIATTSAGTATASLPAALTSANSHHTLTALARRRVQADRERHRERKTKARPGFPAGGPRLPTRTAPAQIALCSPSPAQAPPSPITLREPITTRTEPARTTARDPIAT
jgi:hypothetical protein